MEQKPILKNSGEESLEEVIQTVENLIVQADNTIEKILISKKPRLEVHKPFKDPYCPKLHQSYHTVTKWTPEID